MSFHALLRVAEAGVHTRFALALKDHGVAPVFASTPLEFSDGFRRVVRNDAATRDSRGAETDFDKLTIGGDALEDDRRARAGLLWRRGVETCPCEAGTGAGQRECREGEKKTALHNHLRLGNSHNSSTDEDFRRLTFRFSGGAQRRPPQPVVRRLGPLAPVDA